MISLESIEEAIIELEKRDTTFTNCAKLADLYVVKDHLQGYEGTTIEGSTASEFMRAVDGVDYSALLPVLNEHMDAIELLYPKEYDKLIHNIQDLKE